MPRLPLVGVNNQRGIDGTTQILYGRDQRFVNCTFDLVKNPITGKATVYVEKRPGWGVSSTPAAGSVSTGAIRTDQLGTIVSAFGATNSTIYDGTTSVGAITGQALHLMETVLGGTGYVLIRSSDGTAWYYADDAKSATSYTGDTHTNTTIDSIASTAGMYSGQAISGSGIQAGTRILTVDSSNQITTDTATTATASGVTITKTPVAKILDADFVTTGNTISTFVALSGYLFYCADDGYVYNSDLNSIIAYTASNKIQANMGPDIPTAIARSKSMILCFKKNSIEPFYNAGNATGSPLNEYQQYYRRVGTENQRSIVQYQDDIYFASSSRNGEVGISRLSDMNITPISTPHIDMFIGTLDPAGVNIYMNAFEIGGYPYISATVTGSPTNFLLLESGDKLLLESGDKIILDYDPASFYRMFVYNIQLNIWNEWNTTIPTFVGGLGAGATNQIFATSVVNTSGKIYLINPAQVGELYEDDGSSYTMTIQTAKIDHGTRKRKFDERITLVSDVQLSGTATLYTSDDDYATWDNRGTFDLTQKHPSIVDCGSYEGYRAYKIETSDNVGFRAEALDIDVEIGEL